MKKFLLLTFAVFLFAFFAQAIEIQKKEAVVASKKPVSAKFQMFKDGTIKVDGYTFKSLQEYAESNYFKEMGKRCGTQTLPADVRKAMSDGSDCASHSTTIKEEYNLTDYIVIPVVFHIIYKSDGTGNISDELILSQIDSMNKAYGADPSFTQGSYDTHIKFELAGITRTENDDWFGDSNELEYKSALGWDQTKYLNIYTNSASGYLGYSYFPQSSAGSVRDGVVVNYAAVGQFAGGWQYDEGDTLNHEIGHYLGLYHTFQDGCVANTYTSGDCIVDTNSQNNGDNIYDCTDINSCGTPDPIHNYMNYTDDACLFRFTPEQSNRMVCALINYRPNLWHYYVEGLPEFSSFIATPSASDLSVTFTVTATDPDGGNITSYKWDFDNDGTIDITTNTNTTSHTYSTAGQYGATVTVVDDQGQERKSWMIEVNAGTGSYPSDTYSNHLYIPLSMSNTEYTAYLGLQNPGDSVTNYTINFVGANGYVVAPAVSGTINALSKSYNEAISENIDAAYWIMIGYDNKLNAYLELVSHDGSKSGAIKASEKLDSKLFVPHIAADTNFWNTYSSIVNGTSSSVAANFNYLAGTMSIESFNSPYGMRFFEWYDDLFSSGAPANFKNWGVVESSTSSICGMEMFSTKGELQTMGALDLSSDSSDTLYFAHVDAGSEYWWTGVVIENVSDTEITVDFIPYDKNGNQLTSVSYTMGAHEKLVNIVENVWTSKSVQYPDGVAWFKVVATGGNIIGYELFGTEESAERKLLAGINATIEGKLKLTYPHIQYSDSAWTGLTVVNISDETASLTAKAYDASGNLLAEKSLSTAFPANAKFVDVVENIFSGGFPEGTKTITIESDKAIAGFEMWGDMPQTRISGMLAFGEGTPTSGDYVYFESFEATDYTESSLVPDGWEVFALTDNVRDSSGWASASAITFTEGTWLSNYPQTVPHGNDYMVGMYGSSNERNHQLLVSKAISLPNNVTTLEFMSQFGWPSDATKSCILYVFEGTGTPDLSVATKVFEFTPAYMQSLNGSTEADAFTEWKQESFDISSFAGKTVRICFEISSQWEESWHIDSLGIK